MRTINDWTRASVYLGYRADELLFISRPCGDAAFVLEDKKDRNV